MNKNHALPIKQTLQTALEKTYGAKGVLWLGFCLIVLLLIGNYILQLLSGEQFLIALSVSFISQIIMILVEMGMLYVGINKAADKPVNSKMLFYPFQARPAVNSIALLILIFLIFLPIVIALALVTSLGANSGDLIRVFTALLIVLFIVALVYLYIRTWLSFAFVLDKGQNPVQAIKSSFQATHGNFWRLLVVFVLQIVIIILSLITIVPSIWALPFCIVLYGVIYHLLAPKSSTQETIK